MNDNLPNWVWDLVIDLLDEEDLHPPLYYQSFDGEKYHRYDWCPSIPLERVPDEVKATGRVLARYRIRSVGEWR